MFRRRGKLAIGPRIRGFLWPKGGWRRAASYFLHRVKRLPGSPYSIAAGLACGAAVSFTPFIGLHFFLGALIAWLIGGNLLASAIGTAIGNPWTFPFIWTWLYQTGAWIISAKAQEGADDPKFTEIFGRTLEALLGMDAQYLFEAVAPVFWPMLVSSLPTGLVVWWVFYLPLKYIVRRYQDRRRRRLEGGNGKWESLQ